MVKKGKPSNRLRMYLGVLREIRREGKGREGNGRERKGTEGKGREGKGREGG